MNSRNNVQPNKRNGQEKPPLEKLYVALPGHPFYGQQVKVISRQAADTYTRCTVENPTDPNFHYQIPAGWLSSVSPPPEVETKPTENAIHLSLRSLDKMAQMILAKSQDRKDDQNAQYTPRNDSSNLEPDPRSTQSPVETSSLLPGAQSDRRK